MIELVKEYSGKGKFFFDIEGETVILDLKFNLIQYSNAEIIVECLLNYISQEFATIINALGQRKNIEVSMDGEIFNPYGIITFNNAFLKTLNMNFEDSLFSNKLIIQPFEPVEILYKDIKSGKIELHAGAINFIYGNCGKEFNGFKIDLNDFIVKFVKNKEYYNIEKALKEEEKKFLLTSEAIIIPKENKINFTEILWALSDLISYSCRIRISFIYEDYYFENKLFKTILNPLLTKEFNTKENRLIDSNHIGSCNLKSYLELTYPKYFEFKNQFGLNIVISLYLELLTIKYIDMQFLLAVTALETILNGYAEMRQETGNPITRSILRRNKKKTIELLEEYDINNNEIACKIVEEISNPYLNIHDKLNDFINNEDFRVELNEFDRDFVFIRNKIAHTGKFPKKIKYNGTEREISLGEEFNRLIYLLDRIILTILNYKEKPFYNELKKSETML